MNLETLTDGTPGTKKFLKIVSNTLETLSVKLDATTEPTPIYGSTSLWYDGVSLQVGDEGSIIPTTLNDSSKEKGLISQLNGGVVPRGLSDTWATSSGSSNFGQISEFRVNNYIIGSYTAAAKLSYSTDGGVNFLTATFTPAAVSTVTSICGPDRILAFGAALSCYTSVNGINYTALGNTPVQSVQETQGVYVPYLDAYITPLSGTGSMISFNAGVSWTVSTSTRQLYQIIVGDNLLLASGTSGISISYDGLTWIPVIDMSITCRALAYSPDKKQYVVLQNNAPIIQYSSDGLNWTLSSQAGSTSAQTMMFVGGDIQRWYYTLQSTINTFYTMWSSPDVINYPFTTTELLGSSIGDGLNYGIMYSRFWDRFYQTSNNGPICHYSVKNQALSSYSASTMVAKNITSPLPLSTGLTINSKVFIGTRPIMTGGYSMTTPVTVANTVVDSPFIGTGVGTLTIPANGFYVGTSSQARLYGLISALVANTITFNMRVGGIIVNTMLVTPGAVTNALWSITLQNVTRSIGVSGTVQSNVKYSQSVGGIVVFDRILAVVDSTISNVFSITVQWSAPSASNSITLDSFNTFNQYTPP